MITNIIITFTSSIRKQKGNLYVLQIVLGANKNKLPKGNRKDSGKEVCFRTHFSLSSVKEIQRERDGRASGRLQVSRLSSNTFKTCRLNSNLHCSELEIY